MRACRNDSRLGNDLELNWNNIEMAKKGSRTSFIIPNFDSIESDFLLGCVKFEAVNL